MARITATAKQKGFVNTLVGAVKELKSHRHRLDVYATGDKDEAGGCEGEGV